MAELDLDPRCTASRPPPSAPRLLCVLPSSFPLSAWVSIWLFGLFYHSLGTLSVFVSCPSTPEVFEVGDCDCPSWYLRDSIAQDAGSCQSLGFIYVTSILKHLLEQVYRWVPKRPSPQVFSTRCVFCGFQQMGLYPGEGVLWSWPWSLGGMPTHPPLASHLFLVSSMKPCLAMQVLTVFLQFLTLIELLSCLF